MAKAPEPACLRTFFGYVDTASSDKGCWLWRGSINNNGYGSFGGDMAHRVAYGWMVGDIPAGLTIDHLCLERLCVNPSHIEAVTQSENVKRANLSVLRRGRCRRGHLANEDNVRFWKNKGGKVTPYCVACRRENRARRKAA